MEITDSLLEDSHRNAGLRNFQLTKVLEEIGSEYLRAKRLFPENAHSEHEAYAILLEEVDELKNEVWRNQRFPDRLPNIRKESIQVAAMCLRMILERCDKQ